jgi:hypothetical protein
MDAMIQDAKSVRGGRGVRSGCGGRGVCSSVVAAALLIAAAGCGGSTATGVDPLDKFAGSWQFNSGIPTVTCPIMGIPMIGLPDSV